MTKHPSNRLERRKLDQKKKKEQRDGRVWKKLSKEYAKEQEAENELRDYTRSDVQHIS